MVNRKPMLLHKLSFAAAATVLVALAGTSNAAVFTSISTGTWDSPTTWAVVGFDGDGIPDADDDVSVSGIFTVSLDANQACQSLTVAAVNALNLNNFQLTIENNFQNSGTVTGDGATLVVGNDGTGNLVNNGTFSVPNASITVNGDTTNTLAFSINSSTMLITGDLFNTLSFSFSGANVTVENDVTNTITATITGDVGGTLNLRHDFSMGGLVTITNFNCDGTTLQTITGASNSVTITNMTVNNTSNVDLNRPLVIGSNAGASLRLIAGQVLTTDTDLLTLRTPQLATVGNLIRMVGDTGYCNPVFARDVNTTLLVNYLYPVGTGLGYTPASFSFTDASDTPGGIRVHVFDGDQPNVAANAPSPDLALDRFWRVAEVVIPNSGVTIPTNYSADLSLTYLDGDINLGATEANYRVARDKVAPLKYQTYATTMNTATNTGTGTPIVVPGDYTLVEQDPGDPLAVTLTSFTAESAGAGSTVTVKWSTAGEFNNAGFKLYRANGNDKGTLLTPTPIAAQGSEFSGADYQFIDATVLSAGEVRGYFLEDIDASSVATLHGPAVVSASANSDADAVLGTLNLLNWENGTAEPFTAPTFASEAGVLTEGIPAGANDVFGYWQTRLPLAPLPAGKYNLGVHLDWSKLEGKQAPDVRIRVFEYDNAKNTMTQIVDRTANGKTLPEHIETTWTSDGTSDWRVAVDILGFVENQGGSVSIMEVMNTAEMAR